MPQQAADQQEDSDDEPGGKLHSIRQSGKESSSSAKPAKVFNKQQLLAVPVENLSKWQKKRLRQKEKRASASAAAAGEAVGGAHAVQ